jgi:type 1 glutamine amidotransferase
VRRAIAHVLDKMPVRQFTELITAAAADTTISNRTWVLLTEAVDGGWGLAGHAHTNAELVEAARAEIAALRSKQADEK